MRAAALRRTIAAAPKPREACAPCATQPQRAKSTAVKRMPAASAGRAPLVENVRGSIYGEPQPVPPEFRNVDGERLEDGRYAAFREEATLSGAVKAENVFTDPVRTFAYGTDASFYRLIPKMVLKVETEREIQSLLKLARKHRTPVTFRAAGTSLSGQAVTDSILLKLSHTGKNWRRHAIGEDGKTITVEPGLIGGEVNRLLGSYAKRHEKDTTYRLGPDPASIDSCMACEVDKLADMSVDLIDMFERHGYGDASVFGHAMEGNMHLVFSQGFRNASDIDQFARMMQVRSRRFEVLRCLHAVDARRLQERRSWVV